MSIFILDVETDGNCPGIHNMVWFGAVRVDKEGKFEDTFEGKCKPIFPKNEETEKRLAISGLTYSQCLEFPDPAETMQLFSEWINLVNRGKASLYSDNNGFDYGYANYYLTRYTGSNPFGWSSRNINSLWHGMQKDCFKSFKFLRKTRHTHNPVDDAIGNGEALYAMKHTYGLKIKF